ncbi:hypothetical protein DN539_31885 [Burkholderia multivorans]|uniref:hypothetical protein n=1 Tax=Burkholderia multivorans TaxID=87883 RepID=UPI000DAC48ED|nr:hypothetical protein DN539_31885 [Burkholderia multivorans]
MPWWIALFNTLAALASTGFGVAALVKPGMIAPQADEGTQSRFYPAMYAARAIPLGLAVGIAVWLSPASIFLFLLLGTAILAQVGDVIIGVLHRLPGMITGAVFAVLCHGAAVLALL